jgi:copper homeostasis protein
MIRPRPGDFIFGQADLDVMLAEIDIIREAGLAGVVLGASRPGGALDDSVLRQLTTHAAGLGTTLHRAVDLVSDFDIAVDLAADLGFERILTSGGGRHAVEGMDTIAAMISRAGGRVAIMAGSGVRPANVGVLLDRLKLKQVHASCSGPARTADAAAVRLGFADPAGRETSAEIVAELKRALRR